ncbi:hypothetical protein A2619_01005 [candidate division WWE3 bacterium RIFOXYD1_FULL_39_9]|nr:MAG: hypothetical protein A2619_01005 [candidate division WWE3 bacterium RIFOXYD1_FULL_39_9]
MTAAIRNGYTYDPEEEESDHPLVDEEKYPFAANEDDEEYYPKEVAHIVYAECAKGWYSWTGGISKTELDATKQRFEGEHSSQCGCSAQITFSIDEE